MMDRGEEAYDSEEVSIQPDEGLQPPHPAGFLSGLKKHLEPPALSCYNEKKGQEEFFMVKHIILWQLKDELSDAEKVEIKAGIKAGLEGLAGQIPGLIEIKVHTNGLPSSNADLMLDTTFETAEALKGYSTHPAHVAVANSKVRPYYKNRVCLDYEV